MSQTAWDTFVTRHLKEQIASERLEHEIFKSLKALRALQSDHHQKLIISPQKCALIPQNVSFNHIYFTLKNDFRTFVEKCCNSHLRPFVGQIRQDVRNRWWWWWGGGKSTKFWQCQDFGNNLAPISSLIVVWNGLHSSCDRCLGF